MLHQARALGQPAVRQRGAPEQVVCDDKGAGHGREVERLAELERVGLALRLQGNGEQGCGLRSEGRKVAT